MIPKGNIETLKAAHEILVRHAVDGSDVELVRLDPGPARRARLLFARSALLRLEAIAAEDLRAADPRPPDERLGGALLVDVRLFGRGAQRGRRVRPPVRCVDPPHGGRGLDAAMGLQLIGRAAMKVKFELVNSGGLLGEPRP